MKKLLPLLLLLSLTGFAGESLETDDFKVALDVVSDLSQELNTEEILFVTDLDNTLLSVAQPLGTPEWFDWQARAIQEGSAEAFVPDFQSLLDLHNQIFMLASMQPPQQEIPAYVAKISTMSSAIILTSRGPDMRSATERALRRADISFVQNSIGPIGGYPSRYKPHEGSRFVSYQDGIYMTAGQDKGQMLRALLEKTRTQPKAIVFIDDKEKHTREIESAFKETGIDIWTIRYSAKDESVQNFEDLDKSELVRQWQSFRTALTRIIQ